MGSRKISIENINEGATNKGKEGISRGAEILGQAGEISSVFEGLNLDIDEDDQEVIEQGKQGYDNDMHAAYQEQASEKAKEASEEFNLARQESDSEKAKVESIASEVRKAGSVSEIGRHNAENIESKMENSREFYEQAANEALDKDETIQEEVRRMHEELDGLF